MLRKRLLLKDSDIKMRGPMLSPLQKTGFFYSRSIARHCLQDLDASGGQFELLQ